MTMIVLVNTETNECKQLTPRQLFDMFADPEQVACMSEPEVPAQVLLRGERVNALVYYYTPSPSK